MTTWGVFRPAISPQPCDFSGISQISFIHAFPEIRIIRTVPGENAVPSRVPDPGPDGPTCPTMSA
jgi:hypothetical protein